MSKSNSSIYWAESLGGMPVPMAAHAPDPCSSQRDFYYNTTENQLYRLETTTNAHNDIKIKVWTKSL